MNARHKFDELFLNIETTERARQQHDLEEWIKIIVFHAINIQRSQLYDGNDQALATDAEIVAYRIRDITIPTIKESGLTLGMQARLLGQIKESIKTSYEIGRMFSNPTYPDSDYPAHSSPKVKPDPSIAREGKQAKVNDRLDVVWPLAVEFWISNPNFRLDCKAAVNGRPGAEVDGIFTEANRTLRRQGLKTYASPPGMIGLLQTAVDRELKKLES